MRRCYLPATLAPWSELMAYALRLSKAGWEVNIVPVSAPCGAEVG
jgi:hypothetical protein